MQNNQDRNLFRQTDRQTIAFFRGLAILMVFIVHYGQSFGNPAATRFGQMGCQVFFVISGFTCSNSFKRVTSKKEFYKKRLLSIAPGYCTMVLIVVLTNFIYKKTTGSPFVGIGNTSVLSVCCNLLLLHGLFPFCNNNVMPVGWFTGTIIILYALHPIIIAIYEKSHHRSLLAIVGIVVSVLTSMALNYLWKGSFSIVNCSFLYYFFTSQIGCYLLGINLSYSEKQDFTIKKKVSLILLSAVCLFLAVTLFYGQIPCRYSIAIVMMGLATYCALQIVEVRRLPCILVKHISNIGNYSFFVYLTHFIITWPIVNMLKEMLIPKNTSLIVAFVILLIPALFLTWCLSVALSTIVRYENGLILRLKFGRNKW